MAAFLLLCTLLLLFSISSGQNTNIIGEACKAAHHPLTCEAWLSQSGRVPPNATALQVIQSGLLITYQNLDKGRAMVEDILKNSTGNTNRSTIARTCLEMMHYAKYRINLVGVALRNSKLKDARAWMSAALEYQYNCWSALKYMNDTSQVTRTMLFFNSTLIANSSSTLSLMVNYDIYGQRTGSWTRPKTERDGFWEPAISGNASAGGVPPGLKADVTVCKGGGGCNYTTVQEAVNAAPPLSEKRFVIWIKAGVYEEIVRVPLEKKNVVFLGDGMGKTVITGSMSTDQTGVSTYNTATVGIVGDGFMATGLTIQNTAGPKAHHAVAFRSDSDHSIIENCSFVGSRGTLYAHSLRQYYKSCLIQGNVDFIFGNSAALFEDCHILVPPRQLSPEKADINVVTAQGRTDPAQSTGFVFRNCVVNGTEAYMGLYYKNPKMHWSYLGRPWKNYSRTVFIECVLEAVITGEGWMSWHEDFALLSLYFGEFRSSGAGADMTKRVAWSNMIPTHHVVSYSALNFIQG